MCSNLLRERQSEPLVPSGPGFGVRFWFLSRLGRVARGDPPREWFVGMIEGCHTVDSLAVSYLISYRSPHCHVAATRFPTNDNAILVTSPHMTADSLNANGPSPHAVQLGEGPPTKEELLVYYPPKFTWKQLKTFVNSGYFYMLYVSMAIVESLPPGTLGCSNVTRNFRNDMIVGLKGSKPSMEAKVIDSCSSYCISHPP
jgi:hypothetical protein